ncbi:MAG: SBBP repeat-containing protein [Ignavibacteria bacterium]|nr:SBBP repeat-containing protein [Ignavibacteria bacterium]
MKDIIVIIISMTFYINIEITYSQITQEWTARYGQTGINGGNAVVTDSLGNVYVTGSEGSPPDIVTIKYSSSGQQEWLSRYNGSGNGRDGANSIKIDNKGNIIVAGKSEGIGTSYDFITIKYSPSGEQKWFTSYAGFGNQYDEISSIDIDSKDNIYITGLSNENYATIKYDSSGNQQWIKFYGTENNFSYASAIIIDKYGNIYITGQSGENSTNSVDIVTIKYNSLGVQKWVAKYNSTTSENDYGLAIGVDSNGNVYVCGGSQGIYIMMTT